MMEGDLRQMLEAEAVAYRDFLAQRRAELVSRIEDACRRAGRSSSEVELMAVSKTVGPDEVVLAREVGYTAFGENRPQELKRKISALKDNPTCSDITFDMIGNLQKNKVNQVLGQVRLVHSVSSMHLAEALDSRSKTRGFVTSCLIEVNVSGEESKSGFSVGEAREAARGIQEMEGLSLKGLMCMAPAYDLGVARRSFSGLRDLKDELEGSLGTELPVLSCGMSGDFEVAVEEGSTILRLGRIVFDQNFQE